MERLPRGARPRPLASSTSSTTSSAAKRTALLERARRQRAWSEEGKKKVKRSDEPDKNIRAFKTARSEKQASKAKITERAIDRLQSVEKPWEGWELRLELAPQARSGDVVVRLEQAVMQRGTFTLGPIDLEIGWQERVAILGANGTGKTTLLRGLLGRPPAHAGPALARSRRPAR